MGLETATTPDELNELWPLGSDGKNQGDDHIRLLKSVLKGYAETVTAENLRYVAEIKVTSVTSSGTYTKPENLLFLEVEGIGPGGSGSGCGAQGAGGYACGSGGGAGAYSRKLFKAADLGATQSYTIGAAGAGVVGQPGATGGTTTFGSMSLSGGGGGAYSGSVTSGAVGAIGGGGGVSGGGDVNGYGANGGGSWSRGATEGGGVKGFGGSSLYGRGGRDQFASSWSGGEGAAGYGAGGGGSITISGAGAIAGGSGGPSFLRLTEYLSVMLPEEE